jgi:hypothetical protein
MGKYNALFHGTAHYDLASLALDTLLGQDGVSCTSCHTIGPGVGNTFSGVIPYDTTRTVYGPFPNPSAGPMQLYEGYTPTYSTHMNQARICSSCHTLITESVDTSGNYTGGIFVEQATYHEYLNSQFPADSITCQTCHMPHLDGPVVIANGFASLLPRYPFNQHEFVGANSFMLTLIKNNKTSLGADAEDWQFDSTILATKRLLTDSALLFNLHLDSATSDTGFFNVRIQNRAGHKFPSGYPSRRAVVQFLVIDALGDTVFKSGTFTGDYRVFGENPSFEPHHDVIQQSGVPQIYELVMGDVNHHFTSVLERAAILLKDNRIPPVGFTTLSTVYDTVKISTDAVADSDFNKINSLEGSGIDVVHYHVPLAGAVGNLNIHARMYYQSVPPKWVDELLSFNSAEIDSFRTMFNSADQTPLLMASDSLLNIGMGIGASLVFENEIQVYPTLSTDGNVFIKSHPGNKIRQIDVYSFDGRKEGTLSILGINTSFSSFSLPSAKTVYLMKILTDKKIFYRKVVRQ